jgi:hypothetical protein
MEEERRARIEVIWWDEDEEEERERANSESQGADAWDELKDSEA